MTLSGTWGAFLALMWNGFREARRNRITVVVAVFAIVLVLSSALVTEVTVISFERVLTDVGIGSMSLMLAVLAVFLSSAQLSREIDRRNLFLVLGKPISRGTFLLGRFAGTMLTLLALLLLMGALFCVEVYFYGTPLRVTQLTAIGMLWIELLVLSSIGFLTSSFASQYVSAIVTIAVYFAGHLSSDLYKLSERTESLVLQWVGKLAYYVIPNLTRLNFRSRATYDVPAPLSLIADSAVYGVLYSAAVLALALFLFSRRDFK